MGEVRQRGTTEIEERWTTCVAMVSKKERKRPKEEEQWYIALRQRSHYSLFSGLLLVMLVFKTMFPSIST